jgi:opacity protein-like surface antigen
MPAFVGHSDRDPGFYLNGEAGPSFMPNFQSSRFGFQGNFQMDTGTRVSAEPGYNFLATERLTLGGEAEISGIYNRFSHVQESGVQLSRRGDFYQMPLLANMVLKFHTDSFVIPYIGIGGGGDFTWARIDSPGFSGHDDHHDEIDPAVQAMGGVRFRLNPNMDLGLGYKFLADFPNEGKYIATHSVMVSFSVKF